MREQRAHARKMMHEQGFIADPGGNAWVPVILLDISMRGLCFATPEALESGTLRQVRFTLPGCPAHHHCLVNIVHGTTSGVPCGFKIGAMFVGIEAGTSDGIMDFLSKSAQDASWDASHRHRLITNAV